MATSTMSAMSGFMTVTSEMPDDFMAVSSTCSPRSPKVIIDASNMASGNAMGTSVSAA